MAIELDLNEHEEEILADVLATYGYENPTDFVRQLLKIHRAEQRVKRLESIASRMFPDGTPTSRGLR